MSPSTMINHGKFRQIFLLLFRLGLGIFLLWLSVREVRLDHLMVAFSSAKLIRLLVAVCSVLASLFIKLMRWGYLLQINGIGFSWKVLIRAYFLGQSANILMPFRSGEFVRIGWLRGAMGKGTAVISSTILVEKYLDLLMLTIITMAIIPGLPLEYHHLVTDRIRQTLLIFSAGMVLLLWAFPSGWKWMRSHWRINYDHFLRYTNALDDLAIRVIQVRTFKKLLVLFGYSIVIWALMGLTNKIVFQAFQIQAGWDAAALVLVLVTVGLIPAVMPANIGPFYFFAMLALIPYNVPEQIRLVYAVALHAVVTLPPIILAAGLLIGREKDKTVV
jgi:glycosyltransferase 2 family protein